MEFCKQRELCRSHYNDDQLKSVLAQGVVGFMNLFVTTLCKTSGGETLYVTVPTTLDDAAGRKDGKQKGQEVARRGGLSSNDCRVHAVYGVKSQTRLKTDLTVTEPISVSPARSGKIRQYKLQRRTGIRVIEVLE
jgi:hypothetical protein